MIILYHKVFRKHFKKRIVPNFSLVKKFEERLQLFLINPTHPSLQNHRLIGHKKEYCSFSIAGDIRVIYKIENETIKFYDVGSHNQVYAN